MEHKGQTVNLGDTQGKQNSQGADVDGKGSDSILPVARDLTPASSVFVCFYLSKSNVSYSSYLKELAVNIT